MIQNTFGKKQTTTPTPLTDGQLVAFAKRSQHAPAVLVMRRLRTLSVRNALVSILIAVDLSPAWAALTSLLRSASDAAHLPPLRPVLVLASAKPNGPNNAPFTHFTNVVGLEVAA